MKKCVADDSTLDLVEQRTRGQTSCKLWQELHRGRITSSRFGEVARLQTSTCPDHLVADIMGYSDHVSTPAMRWGKNNEDRACAAYLTYMRGKGHDIEYVPSGLHLHCESTFLGAGSDGHVFDSTENCYTAGGVEINGG